MSVPSYLHVERFPVFAKTADDYCIYYVLQNLKGPSWPWSYASWIYNYLCDLCISPLMLWVRISIRARCTALYDKVCQWLATGRWFSPNPPVSSTNKTDHHDMPITEILLKVALITIKQTHKQTEAKYCRRLHWKACSTFQSIRKSISPSFRPSFRVHISAFLLIRANVIILELSVINVIGLVSSDIALLTGCWTC